MKFNLYKYIISITFLAFILSLALSGCSYYVKPVPPPLTISEIANLCKRHVPKLTIIKRLRASHEIFYLTARQIIKLHKEGITSGVLNYMLRTGIRNKQHRAFKRGRHMQPCWVWQNWQWTPFAPYPYFYPY